MINNIARRRLLKEIKETDFVLKELNLFLDTHPDHQEALRMFSTYEKKAERLKAEYTRLFGPLTPSVNNNTTTWEWIQGPWPWENR